MPDTRRSFLGSIGALFSGIPFLSRKKKVKETFAVQIEEIGEQRFRATLKTSGFFGHKIAVIDSPIFDESHPVKAYAKAARLAFVFEIQRAMRMHVFPEDSACWSNPMMGCFDKTALPNAEGWSEEECLKRWSNDKWGAPVPGIKNITLS